MKILNGVYVIVFLAVASALPISAGPVTLVDFGAAGPPGSVGGYAISSFAADAAPVGAGVNSAGSGAGTVSFDNSLVHYTIGHGWSSWSHGYAGSVYWFDQIGLGVDTLTLTLPANTRAFQFYLEPNFLGTQSVGISAANGGALQDFGLFSINGNGAAGGFGLYVAPGDASLSAITITGLGTFPDGFAVGEFGINLSGVQNVPDGGSTSLMLGGVLFALAAMRRFVR